MHTLDPTAGTGTLVLTANGYMSRADYDAFLKAEAERLRKQTPLEVEHA
jgi:hypothetical protein